MRNETPLFSCISRKFSRYEIDVISKENYAIIFMFSTLEGDLGFEFSVDLLIYPDFYYFILLGHYRLMRSSIDLARRLSPPGWLYVLQSEW